MRQLIVAEAREYIGTKFQHQARLKGVGCDCAGLVVGVAKTFGLTAFDMLGYAPVPDGTTLKKSCQENMQEIPTNEIDLGDVLLFRFHSEPTHLAIVGDHPHGGFSIIHSYAPSRKVVEVRLDEVWLSRIVAAYRFKGVA
jgi:NlpC/P60 family putative phage cell wall peptidase